MEPAGIVIGAAPDGSGWLKDLLASLETRYPVLIDETWDFELHSIALGAETFSEFVFLPYSTEVKDNRLWGPIFGHYRATSVALSQTPVPFGMYMGKYLSEVVREVGCPPVVDKIDAVILESAWTSRYAAAAWPWVALGDLPDTQVFVERYGRRNMVVENQYLRRFKGCWNGSTLRQAARRAAEARSKVTA